MNADDLGRIIRRRRKDAGLTQQQLADESGCGLVLVSQVERGKPTAQIGKVLELLSALGLDVEIRERPVVLPVLFLDIDGVLLPGRHHEAEVNAAVIAGRRPELPWGHLLGGLASMCVTECCPQVISEINALLERTRARLVLISTWRRAIGAEETRQILTLQGLTERWHPDYAAPWHGDKGEDIAAWLAAHREVTQWAVIDDDEIWPVGDARCGQHIRPDFRAGPRPAHWRRLEAALRRRTVD